jgi:uncharacterized RDD family membrane protein YckC
MNATTAPAGSGAHYAARTGQTRRNKQRTFVTPEGVDLKLEIASSSLRVAALIVDIVLMVLILLAFTLIIGFGAGSAVPDLAIIVWLLGFFLLRNFWFISFELGPRAATPGKRAMGIRVVARDGGRLTVASVVARNLVREIEIMLPLTFIFSSSSVDGAWSGAMIVAGIVWSFGLGLFLLFNRDRMRLGDLIGGTWVVMARRRKIAEDLSTPTIGDPAGAPTFTNDELAVYGIYELQELERVLRQGDRDTMIAVADTIRAKLGRTLAEDDRAFLTAYYRQAKARMERDLLFGKRRENKYEAAQ